MKYRKQSITGDYEFGNNLKDFYIDSPQAVLQAVITRLKLWRNEWFVNLSEGVPYFQILGKSDERTRNEIVRMTILNTEGVESINEFETNVNPINRKLSISCSIITVYGPTVLKVEV